MGKNTSYKSMLRDRCPLVVDLALKWCKAKTCWVDHVYDNFIGILVDKSERNEATRTILGISKKYRNFDFHKTVHWDDMDPEDKESWENVEYWVKWFQDKYVGIESHYTNFMRYSDHEEIKQYILDNYTKGMDESTANSLAEFITTALENN